MQRYFLFTEQKSKSRLFLAVVCCIAALCVTVVWLLVTALIHNFIETFSFEDWLEIFCYLFAAVAVVAFVTIATIVNKIYRVSKINAADVIKKD